MFVRSSLHTAKQFVVKFVNLFLSKFYFRKLGMKVKVDYQYQEVQQYFYLHQDTLHVHILVQMSKINQTRLTRLDFRLDLPRWASIPIFH